MLTAKLSDFFQYLAPMRIFLIGFMGSGKSYTAKKMSAGLNLNHLDLDAHIVKKGGQSISTIFKFGGEQQFRKIENHELKWLINEQEDFVMACGGGTPCFHDNMDIMLDNGVVVFINASEEVIFERIKNSANKRPLLQGMDPNEMKTWIADKLEERKAHYLRANISIDVNTMQAKPSEELISYFSKMKR